MTYYMRSAADANSTDAYLPKTTEEKAGAVGGGNAAVPTDPNFVFASVITLQAWQPYPTGGNGSSAISTTPPVETDATLSVPNVDDGGGGGSVINPPTSVAWASAASDTTPDFSMTLTGAIAGDEIVGQHSADGAGVWNAYFTHTLTAPEILAGTVTISGLTPLTDGAWDFRFRTERGAEVSAWSSTVDAVVNLAPTVSAFSPVDGAINVAFSVSPTVTFNKPVQFGTGTINIKKTSDNSLIESFNVATEVGTGNGQVSISGAVLTINPTSDLAASTGYYVQIDATAIENLNDVAFAGIADTTTWNFTASSSSPVAAFIASLSSTASVTTGNSYTFAAASLGTPHADRIVVVMHDSSQALGTPTWGGVLMTVGPSSLNVKLYYLRTTATAIAASTSADLVIPNNSGSTSGDCNAATFVAYPASATPVDSGAISASTTVDAVIADLAVEVGGFVCYFVMAAGGTVTALWTGVDTLVEDYDTTFETTRQYSAGHIAITASSTTDDLTVQESASGTKRVVAISFGAPS